MCNSNGGPSTYQDFEASLVDYDPSIQGGTYPTPEEVSIAFRVPLQIAFDWIVRHALEHGKH